jgi:hypothetical protein
MEAMVTGSAASDGPTARQAAIHDNTPTVQSTAQERWQTRAIIGTPCQALNRLHGSMADTILP